MTNTNVTVYTKPEDTCPACKFTKMKLAALGVAATFVDVTQDDEAKAFVMSLGYSQTPVVVAGEEHWSGFRPDRLATLAA